MKNNYLKVFLLFALLELIHYPFSWGQEVPKVVFKGQILEEQHKLPIPQALFYFNEANKITDEKGCFSLEGNFGDSLLIHQPGYASQKVYLTDTSEIIKIYLSAKQNDLSTIEVLAYGLKSNALTNPAAVSALGSSELARVETNDWAGAFNQIPGVQVQERARGDYRFSIRGSVLQSPWGIRDVKMYWNDIPITTPDNEGPGFLPFGTEELSSVQVIKGPGGSLYGSGLGGVVLFESERPKWKEEKLSLGGGLGSFGYYQAKLAYQYGNERLHLSLRYNRMHSDGYRDNGWSHRDILSLSASVYPSSYRSLSFLLVHTSGGFGIPGAVDSTFAALQPRAASPFAKAYKTAIRKTNTTLFGMAQDLDLGHHLNHHIAFFGTLGYLDHPHGNSIYYNGYLKQSTSSYGLRSHLTWSPWLGAVKSQFAIGTEWKLEHQLGNTFDMVLHPEGGYPSLGSQQVGTIFDANNLLLFARSVFYLPQDFLLTIGGGISFVRFEIEDLLPIGAGDIPFSGQRQFEPSFSPRIAVSKPLWGDGLVFRASAGKGFSTPTTDETRLGDGSFNSDLKAEVGLNYEVGFRGVLLQKRFNYDLSFYWMEVNNLFVPQTDSGGQSYYVNAGKTRQRGIELSLYGELLKQPIGFLSSIKPWLAWSLYDYQFTDYTINKGVGATSSSFRYDGNALTGVPKTTWSGGIDLYTTKGFYFSTNLNHYGRTPINDANTYFQEAYTLWSAQVAYERNLMAGTRIKVAIGGRNLLNEAYSDRVAFNADNNQTKPNPEFWDPSPTRNFFVDVQFTFQLNKITK